MVGSSRKGDEHREARRGRAESQPEIEIMLRLRSGKESSDFWSRARSVLFECENQASGAFRWYRHYVESATFYGFCFAVSLFPPSRVAKGSNSENENGN